MLQPLRVLQIEDSPSDAGLIVRTLEKAGYEVHAERVEDAAGMREALSSQEWDVILADYHVPGFNASQALAALYETWQDVPFIVVSGAIGEDMAAEMMKAGAHDYVLKTNLSRLPPAVEREIREARMRHERRRAEEALRQSEERFRTAFESAAIGMALIASDGRLTSVNQAFCKMLGYSSRELVSKGFQDITHPEDHAVSDKAAHTMLAREAETVAFEKRYIRKDGGVVWAQVLSALLHDASGSPAGFITQIQDVTERRKAEEALRRSEARERARAMELEALMDAAPVALFISRDPECGNILGNRKTYELLRLPQGTNLGQPHGYRILANGIELAPGDLPMQRASRTGQPVLECEFDLVFDDGSSRQMFGNVVPLLDETGMPRGAVGGFLDVTGRKLAEERLRKAQNLESIGHLAGGIAHDFNNILTSVTGNISLVLQDHRPQSEVKPLLQLAIESVERAAALTRQLLAYAGRGAFVRTAVSLSEAAEKTVRLLKASAPKKIEFRTNLAPGLPRLLMDPSQMEQVLINLILNGIEAIGEKQPGVITVSTATSGACLSLVVSDTGSGMDQATQNRIFEPFFTTRFLGRGLGLAAVDGIVRSLRGTISVESSPGQGTQIEILLPAPRMPDEDLGTGTTRATGSQTR